MREPTAVLVEGPSSLQEPIVSPPEVVPATEEGTPIAPVLAAISAETGEQISPEVLPEAQVPVEPKLGSHSLRN